MTKEDGSLRKCLAEMVVRKAIRVQKRRRTVGTHEGTIDEILTSGGACETPDARDDMGTGQGFGSKSRQNASSVAARALWVRGETTMTTIYCR